MKDRIRMYLALLLVAAGCIQFIGYLTKNPQLRGLGISYTIAPLPTVFSTIGGVEGFDSHIELHLESDGISPAVIPLNAQSFSNFRGHYFLKNAYSLFFAYPHILNQNQLAHGLQFALCRENLLKNLDIPSVDSYPKVVIKRIYFGRAETVELIPSCLE